MGELAPYWQSDRAALYLGDVRAVLNSLPPESLHCCITSVPYFGLRAYGTVPQIWSGDPSCEHRWQSAGKRHKGGAQGATGQGADRASVPAQNAAQDTSTGDRCSACNAWRGELGQEPTLAEYVTHLVDVFRCLKRVMRGDSTVWLNIGDAYACEKNGRSAAATKAAGNDDRTFRDKPFGTISGLLKPKDLLLVPHRLAIALQEDGWWVRSDCLWQKRNCLPESVTDRPTNAHEHIFLLTKNAGNPLFWLHRDGRGARQRPKPDYVWVNAETDEERTEPPAAKAGWRRLNLWEGRDYYYDADAVREVALQPTGRARLTGKQQKATAEGMTRNGRGKSTLGANEGPVGRNLRTVWTLSSDASSEQHYATFPRALVRPCVLAGSSEAGCCAACGAPRVRRVERGASSWEARKASGHPMRYGNDGAGQHQGRGAAAWDGKLGISHVTILGWQPSCSCEAPAVPCLVADIFSGTATTGVVATQLGRRYLGIDLQEAYHRIAIKRLSGVTPPLPFVFDAAINAAPECLTARTDASQGASGAFPTSRGGLSLFEQEGK